VLGWRSHAVPARRPRLPDTGNGGYTSVHTDVHLVYDATANKFLPGNHVVLTDRPRSADEFSLDFERKSANTADGPDMTVNSVTVNGHAAAFTCRPARPTRATRTGRTTLTAGARGLAEQPGWRPGEQPAAPA